MAINFTLAGENLYGRQTIPEMRTRVSYRRVRKAKHLDITFMHRAKNGVYDPLTYYHILDLILQMQPGQEFRTGDLMEPLRTYKDQLVWDPTTVGRVLADIADCMETAFGFQPLLYVRRWNGMYYVTSTDARAQVALINVLDDLTRLGEAQIAEELTGKRPKRFTSPMTQIESTQ